MIRRRGLLPMIARDPGEPHRAASPLELFFDLVFVIAVSIATTIRSGTETTMVSP